MEDNQQDNQQDNQTKADKVIALVKACMTTNRDGSLKYEEEFNTIEKGIKEKLSVD